MLDPKPQPSHTHQVTTCELKKHTVDDGDRGYAPDVKTDLVLSFSYLQKAADSSVAFCNHITALREARINQNTIQNTSNKEMSSEPTARTHQLTVLIITVLITYLII